MMERAWANRNPFDFTVAEEVEQVFAGRSSLDRDQWAAAFSAPAGRWEEQALAAEASGDRKAAREAYLRAYGYWRVARYPAPNSADKKSAYRKSQELYLKAGQYMDPPL